MYYWLMPLNMLEQDIATIASNPDQLLPPPANSRKSLPVLDAQYQLRRLHQKVRQSIRQRQRLADGGEAVAKINHNLWNMLDYLSELPAPARESLFMPTLMDELSATAEIRLHYSGPNNLFTDKMMLFRIF